MDRRPNLWVRASGGALLTAAVAIWAFASGTLGGWSSAQVANDKDSTDAGLLSITHSYASTTCTGSPAGTTTPDCGASLYPASVPATGTSNGTDSITNTGTYTGSAIGARARIANCDPVQLANPVSGSSSGAMLPRAGTTFSPSAGPAAGFGSITLNGSTAYASSVGSTSEPTGPAVIGSATYGIGIWFKTTSTSPGALFGFGSNPLDVVATNDRILSLDASGHIKFKATASGASTTSPGTYNNGAWHFAYVAISASRLLIVGLSYTVTVFVDGTQVNSASSGLLGSLSSYTGYWHLGWSPIDGAGRYFAGSLSDFIVDDSGNAPSTTSSNPTSYTSFAPNRTSQWPLNDSGGAFDGSTSSGVLPGTTSLPGGVAKPCASVDVAWQMTSPAVTVTASTPLSTVAGVWKTISASADPGLAQASTITLKRNAAFAAYSAGLILYAPIQMEYSIGGTWTLSFAWDNPAAGTAAGSTFTLATS